MLIISIRKWWRRRESNSPPMPILPRIYVVRKVLSHDFALEVTKRPTESRNPAIFFSRHRCV